MQTMPRLKPPKEVVCPCGNTLTLDRHRTWCEKCGKAVYYEVQDQRRHKFNSLYITGLILLVFGFLTYVFIELIVRPLI